MKNKLLFLLAAIIVLSLSACGNNNKQADDKTKASAVPATKEPIATAQASQVPDASVVPVLTTGEDTEIGFVQKDGCISENDAISFLKTYYGSNDTNGNAYTFTYTENITVDGIEYYAFEVSSISSETITLLISTDGENIIG